MKKKEGEAVRPHRDTADLIRRIIAEVLNENHEEMLKMLDDLPAEVRAEVVNTCGHCGETAAHIAIYKHDLRMLRILLDHGAHPHARSGTAAGDTLLHTAARLGLLSVLETLYETRLCDLEIKNSDGETPLDMTRLAFNPDKDYVDLRLFKNYTATYTDNEQEQEEEDWMEIYNYDDRSEWTEDNDDFPKNTNGSLWEKRRDQHDSRKSASPRGRIISQEEEEQMAIIEGRKLCEAYLIEKIAEDERARVVHLTRDTAEWMAARERHRRIVVGADDLTHHTTFHSHITYREREGELVVSQADRDWFDRYHVGVNTVSRAVFADGLVMDAMRVAARKVTEQRSVA